MKVAWGRWVLLLLLLTGCADEEDARTAVPEFVTPGIVAEHSARFVAAIGESIGAVREARFMAGGSRVLVLDRFSPHLRLFTSNGRLLWTGGQEGDGPAELRSPWGVAAMEDEAVVVQRGRISYWRLDNDSLVPRSEPLPHWFGVQGVEYGCNGDLVLYGLNYRQFYVGADSGGTTASEQTWLYRVVRSSDGSVELEPLWSTPRDASGTARGGHRGALLARAVWGMMVYHRASPRGSGQLMELDCEHRPVRAYSEDRLVHGDSVPVIDPRTMAVEWTNGIIALPDGFAVAIPRFRSRPMRELGITPLSEWSTELFRFRRRAFEQSVLIPEQWFLMDYDARRGALMASDTPQPHFIIVPLPVTDSGGEAGE